MVEHTVGEVRREHEMVEYETVEHEVLDDDWKADEVKMV
jgi:hypothetical protein